MDMEAVERYLLVLQARITDALQAMPRVAVGTCSPGCRKVPMHRAPGLSPCRFEPRRPPARLPDGRYDHRCRCHDGWCRRHDRWCGRYDGGYGGHGRRRVEQYRPIDGAARQGGSNSDEGRDWNETRRSTHVKTPILENTWHSPSSAPRAFIRCQQVEAGQQAMPRLAVGTCSPRL